MAGSYNEFQAAFLQGIQDAVRRQQGGASAQQQTTPPTDTPKGPAVVPPELAWVFNQAFPPTTRTGPTPTPVDIARFRELSAPRPMNPNVYVPPAGQPAPLPGPPPRSVPVAPPLPIERAVSAAVDAVQAAPGAVADVAQAIPGAVSALPGAIGRGISQPLDPLLGGVRRAVTNPRESLSNYPLTRALGQAGESVADYFADPGQIPGDLARVGMAGLNALDEPRQFVAGQAGELAYNVATGDVDIPGLMLGIAPGVGAEIDLPFINWAKDPKNKEAIEQAYTKGYNGFTGGRGVWELYAGTVLTSDDHPILSALGRGVTDTAMDPFSYVGLIGRAGAGIRTAAEYAPNVPRGIRAAGKIAGPILETPAAVGNLLGRAPRAVAGVVGQGIDKLPVVGPAARHLLEASPRQKFDEATDAARRAIRELLGTETPPDTVGRMAPTSPIGPRTFPPDALPERSVTSPPDFTVGPAGETIPTGGAPGTSPMGPLPVDPLSRPPSALPQGEITVALSRRTGGITIVGDPADGIRIRRTQRNPDVFVLQEKNQRGWWEDRQGGLRSQADADHAGRELWRQKRGGSLVERPVQAPLTERPLQLPTVETPPAAPPSLTERPAPEPLTARPQPQPIVPAKPEPVAPAPKRPLAPPPADADRHIAQMVDVTPEAWSARKGEALYDETLNKRRYAMYSSLWLQKRAPGAGFNEANRALAEAGYDRWLNLQAQRVSRHGEVVLDGLRADKAVSETTLQEIARRADRVAGGASRAADATLVTPLSPATGVVTLRPSDVVVDPRNFQPRSLRAQQAGLQEASVEDIVRNFDPQKLDPIKVWRRPDDGAHVVISGHHRLEAARRLGLDAIPATVVEGNLATAKRIARQSNSITPLKPTEYGRALQAELAEGKAWPEAVSAHKLKSSDARRYVSVTHLPENLQELVDGGQLPVPQAAVLGDAVDDGTMSLADAQVFYEQRMLQRSYSVGQLESIFRGLRHRKAGSSATVTDMFSGLDLGAPQANRVFDQLEALGNALAEQEKLKRALRTLSGSTIADPSDARRLTDVNRRIADLNDQVGRGSTPGGSGAIAAYSTILPGLPQLGRQVERFARYLATPTPGRPRPPIPTPISSTIGPLPEERLPFSAETALPEETRTLLDEAIPGGTSLAGQSMRQGFASTRTRVAAEQREYTGLLSRSGLTEKQVNDWSAKRVVERSTLLEPDARRLKELADTWRDVGNLATANADELATEYVARERARALTGYEGMPGWERRYRQVVVNPTRAILHDPVNWGYTLRNYISDETLVALDSARRTGLPGTTTSYNGAKVMLAAAFKRTPENTRGWRAIDGMEIGGVPTKFSSATVDATVMSGTGRASTREARSRLAKVWGWKGEVDQAAERSRRVGYLGMRAEDLSLQAEPELIAEARALVQRRGWDISEAEIDTALDAVKAGRREQTMAPREVYDALSNLAESKGLGVAEQNALGTVGMKRWATLNKRVLGQAQQEAGRPLAVATERNIDRYLSLVVPFHTWQSRVSPYVLEEALRNPALVASFLRAKQGLEKQAEDGNYPGAVKGWLKVLTGPMGMNFYLNPSTFFLLTQLMDQTSFQDDESRSAWGNAREWARRNLGVGIWPVIDTAINLTGAYGAVPIKSPVNLPTARLLLRALDAVKAEAGEGPHTPLIDQSLQWVREQVSDPVSGVIPGAEKVWATDPNAGYFDNLVSMVMQQNPDATPEQAYQWAEDEDSPQFRQANKAMARSGLLTELWNRFSPASGQRRPIQRDIDIATPSAERTPAQQVRRGVAAAGSPAAATLVVDKSAYDNPPGGQPVYLARWNAIASGDEARLRALDPEGRAYGIAHDGSRYYSVEEVMALPEDQRLALADADAQGIGSLGLVQSQQEARSAQRAASPELDAYKDWQGQLFDVGVEAWWRAESQRNPNAKRYYERVRSQGLSPEDMEGRLVGPDAFAAATGYRASVYDPNPLRTGGVTMPGNTVVPGSDYASLLAQEQTEYSQQRMMVDLAIRQLFPNDLTGYDDPAMANPLVKRVVSNALDQAGVPLPEPSQGLRAYWSWSGAQPPGTDTSIAAFLAWRDAFLASMGTQGTVSSTIAAR